MRICCGTKNLSKAWQFLAIHCAMFDCAVSECRPSEERRKCGFRVQDFEAGGWRGAWLP
jgi:hypothetical protein